MEKGRRRDILARGKVENRRLPRPGRETGCCYYARTRSQVVLGKGAGHSFVHAAIYLAFMAEHLVMEWMGVAMKWTDLEAYHVE